MDKNKLIEQRSALVAELKALTALGDSEERKEQTEEEARQVTAKGKEIEALDAKIEKAVEAENRSAWVDGLLKKKFESVTRPANGIPEPTAPEQRQQPLIPATVIQRRNLKGFVGPDANERAYRAGRFIYAALYDHPESRQWCSDHGVELRAQSSNNNFLGGYAVVPEFSQAIIDLREQYGVFRRESRVVPMGSDTLLIPRRNGGLTAYFVGESDSITESDKTWSQVQLTAKKMATLTRWPSELNDDAVISIADDLSSEIAYAFANKEDLCGFLGDGTSTYGGVYGVFPKIDTADFTASIVTAATGNTAFSTLDIEDFNKVVGKLPLYARANAKWFISAAGFSSSMERLMYAAGGNTVSNIAGGTGLSFLGYPVVLSQVLNSTLDAQVSTVVALFGDLRLATTFGDRSGVSVDLSTDRYFENDQIAIRGKERFDIVAHDLGSTSAAGPILGIKTPGA